MKLPTFTFKNQAIWMIALSSAPVAIALLVIAIIRLLG